MDLRRQLQLAQELVAKLDGKVKEDVKWVQENCPITNIRAQMYCKKWGFEKMNNLFKKITFNKQIQAFKKWRMVTELSANEDRVNEYMKWKGSRRLIHMMNNWEAKQIFGAWEKWMSEVGCSSMVIAAPRRNGHVNLCLFPCQYLNQHII